MSSAGNPDAEDEDDLDLSQKSVREYRDFAFTPELSNETHTPFFSQSHYQQHHPTIGEPIPLMSSPSHYTEYES